MKLVKLNKTMNGHGDFMYKLEFEYFELDAKFAEVRQWFIEQWGNSLERDLWQELHSQKNVPPVVNEHWAWERTEVDRRKKCRLFIRGEAELQWVTLRWL